MKFLTKKYFDAAEQADTELEYTNKMTYLQLDHEVLDNVAVNYT